MFEYVEIKLTEEEVKNCYENWDCIESKELIFNANISLALYLVNRYYPKVNQSIYDDVIQSSLVGLWKGVLTYEPGRTKLSTYASRCILNEIKMFFRRYYKHKDVGSIDSPIDEGLTIKDVLSDNRDFTNELEDEFIIDNIFGNLKGMDKDIMVDYFIRGKNQTDIAKKYNKYQTWVSRKIKRIKTVMLEQVVII